MNYIAGTPYLGASVRMYPGPGGYQGELVAWDVANAKKVWSVKDADLPVYSGVLATGGDLVFYGTMEGWFRAVDAHTGKVLWEFKTASGIIGDPITFSGPDGKQYVAIYSGIGGWMGATALPDVSTDDPYATLGATGAMKKIKRLLNRETCFMSSVIRVLALLAALRQAVCSPQRRRLRVCADPNNLPYSNQQQQGFENELARMIANDFKQQVSYTWFAQRGAFFR